MMFQTFTTRPFSVISKLVTRFSCGEPRVFMTSISRARLVTSVVYRMILVKNYRASCRPSRSILHRCAKSPGITHSIFEPELATVICREVYD
jgi:hypothetical protein